MDRRVALLLSALLLVVCTGCTGPDDASGRLDPPRGMRWAGLNGFVVAVPDTWPSIQQQPCHPPIAEVVTFQVPGSPRTDFDCALSWPGRSKPRPSLWIGSSHNWERDLKKTWRPIGVGDDVGYLSPYFGDSEHPKSQGLFSRGFEVPGKVLFEVSAPTKHQVLAILRSVRQLPPGLVPVPRQVAIGGQPADMSALIRDAGFRVRYAYEHAPDWMQTHVPGQFIRTEPPVGTPLRPGSTVTMYVVREP